MLDRDVAPHHRRLSIGTEQFADTTDVLMRTPQPGPVWRPFLLAPSRPSDTSSQLMSKRLLAYAGRDFAVAVGQESVVSPSFAGEMFQPLSPRFLYAGSERMWAIWPKDWKLPITSTWYCFAYSLSS